MQALAHGRTSTHAAHGCSGSVTDRGPSGLQCAPVQTSAIVALARISHRLRSKSSVVHMDDCPLFPASTTLAVLWSHNAGQAGPHELFGVYLGCWPWWTGCGQGSRLLLRHYLSMCQQRLLLLHPGPSHLGIPWWGSPHGHEKHRETAELCC